ncbi:MAG: S-layer homology domain-containing protein [Anaerotignum propionicum]|uniref:S-layer homology domain-containing protein n=2 Tax=Anaerotignum propionicum TaxID=28446 RepID=UPI002B1F594F|nr:S-layer homology domain-containing protein [Anaerotignum propionicum]MEA5057613.1 S-layer homology domain-containing protein [Anaerotignum propionicum]
MKKIFRQTIALALTMIMVITMIPFTALADAPNAPGVTPKLESILVDNFTSGAILKLYDIVSNTVCATATNVTESTYTFENVIPKKTGYYVTQIVNDIEGANSEFVNSILRNPVATAGIGYIDVSNVYPGATVTLYAFSDGTKVSDTPSSNGDGTVRFSELTAGTTYYVMQSINEVVSDASISATVLTPAAPSAPKVTPKVESIFVENFISGATLKLYDIVSNTVCATATNVTESTYTFENVIPKKTGYYVTQTVNDIEGTNSEFVNSILRTPVATAGIGYIDVNNVYPGATVTLYAFSDGTKVSDTPTYNGDGTVRFSGLTNGAQYYVSQSINGVVSTEAYATVSSPTAPLAPKVTPKLESIFVENFTSGATLKLYDIDSNTVISTATNITESTYTFENVVPKKTQYYVTQTVNEVESVNSSFVNSLLRTPEIIAGFNYVDVSNVYSGAAVTLFTFGGVEVSSSPTNIGIGMVRFSGLTPGERYYAIQGINDVVSEASSSVKIPKAPSAPTNVIAKVVNGGVSVSFIPPIDDGGSQITSYLVTSNPGSISSTVTGTSTSVFISSLSYGISYTFTVTATSAAGTSPSSAPSNAVILHKSSGNSGGSSSVTPTTSGTAANNDGVVIVNGKAETAGTITSQTGANGQSIKIFTVDYNKLEKKLETEGKGATAIISLTGDSGIAQGILTGQMVKSMEDKSATLVLKTKTATYTLPAKQIDIDTISQQYGQGVSLADIKVSISIAEPPSNMIKVIENTAANEGFTVMVPGVDFEIACTYNGKTVEVKEFNSYVERLVAIPKNVDPKKITTGVVIDAKGDTRHVPTQVIKIDDNYFAKINSVTNSTYTVIWNPITYTDVEKHWAKDSINNMGSRLVVSGVGNGNYNPDTAITRAEFAAMVVRALGLEPGKGKESFTDINSAEWFKPYVETANQYGIIMGYNEKTFAPNDKITREQAIAMIARSMKLTGIEQELTDQEMNSIMGDFADAQTVANYAKKSLALCLKTGIISGTGNGYLSPKNNVTRAEVAIILEKLLQKSDLI